MLEILRDIGELEVLLSDPDEDRAEDDQLVSAVINGRFDCCVFFQTEYLAERLRPFGLKRLVIIPMYDGAVGRVDAFWRQFVKTRMLSFCRVHHEHLEALDCNSTYFQYFPEPKPAMERDFTKRDAFFWERRPDQAIDLSVVLGLCQQIGIDSLHVHAAPDFSRHTRPSRRPMRSRDGGVQLGWSQWFEKQEDYEAISSAPLFFFAPRLREGIGMAVLEAMSRGQIVVAPDLPTINEYVSHGTTGILYDPAGPNITIPLDQPILERMSRAARLKIEFGRLDWLADTERLKSILLDDGRRWTTRDVSSHFMNLLRRSASQRTFRTPLDRDAKGTIA